MKHKKQQKPPNVFIREARTHLKALHTMLEKEATENGLRLSMIASVQAETSIMTFMDSKHIDYASMTLEIIRNIIAGLYNVETNTTTGLTHLTTNDISEAVLDLINKLVEREIELSKNTLPFKETTH